MPLLAAVELLTPAGNAVDALAAVAAGRARPGVLPDAGGLGALLRRLGDTALAQARARHGGGGADLVLLASTKGDLPRWCAHLLDGAADDEASPVALAVALGRHFAAEAMAVSAACASSPLACGIAARALARRRARRVLVLSGERLAPFVHDGFAALRALAVGDCRPYDAGRDGLVLGETACAVVLDADGAAADGRMHLRGWGAAMDANHATGPARDGAGLRRAATGAIARAGGAPPAAIVGHGTGTRYNDDSESMAWAAACPGVPVVGWKGALGHSLGACGLGELALAVAACAQGRIPGTAGFSRAGTAGAIPVLAPGWHRLAPGPVLLANAGFGGLDAAVVLGREPAPVIAPAAVAMTGRVECDADGWRRTGGPGGTGAGTWKDHDLMGRPRLGAVEVLGHPEAGWGRLDLASRMLVALCRIAGLAPGSGLVLATTAGCRASDRDYEARRRADGADPQRFPFTLPTAPVGEASIRCALTGPGFALPGASDDQARAVVADLLGERPPGLDAIAVARVEADAEAWGWIEVWAFADETTPTR